MKKKNYLIESLSFLGILTLVNVIWLPDNIGFAGIAPHPYWIVVLALTLKYELRAALQAVILSAALYMGCLLIFHKIPFVQVFEFEYFRPVLFFLIFGILGGQVRTSQNKKLEIMTRSKREWEEKYKLLRKRYDEVLKIKDELSERIIGQTSTVSTVYELAKKLNILEIDQLIPAALDFIVEVVGAEKCSFYKYEDSKLGLAATSGWIKEDLSRYKMNEHDEVVRQALTQRRVIALTELVEDHGIGAPETIEANVLMTAPITVGSKKRLYGVINIERMPFLKFNPDSVKLFTVVADWVSHTLTLAVQIQKKASTVDESKLFEQYIQDNFDGNFQFGEPLSEMRKAPQPGHPSWKRKRAAKSRVATKRTTRKLKVRS